MRRVRGWWWLLGASWLLTGCIFDDSAVNAVLCNADSDCAGGQCVEGVCVFAPQDTSGELDVPSDGEVTDVVLCDGVQACADGTECCGGVCCLAEEACCDGMCTNPAFDGANCGACGTACTANEACVSGQCQCRPRFDECDGDPGTVCETEVLASPEHCGTCDVACGAEAPDCVEGNCSCGAAPCVADEACCSVGDGTKSCVNPKTSPRNCGGCQLACGTGEHCVDGACVCGSTGAACADGQVCCGGGCVDELVGCQCGSTTCTAAQTCCGDTCIDPSSDVENCGTCGTSCGEAACVLGECVCTEGRACATAGGIVCIDVLNDVANCGACGNACASGESCCAGTCVAVDGDDADNCGGCGIVCDGTCSGGECACGGGSAVNLVTDQRNCGACGNNCDAHPNTKDSGTSCAEARCVYQCEGGGRDCDPDSPGCETDPTSDDAHCGQCGRACATGSTCSASECLCNGTGDECYGTTANVASASCNGTTCELQCRPGFGDCSGGAANGCEVDLQTDDGNCGACGVDCDAHTHTADATTSCAAGICQYTCDNADWGDCQSGPGKEGCETDIRITEEHCGACGNACPAGATCTAEVCKCDGGTAVCAPFAANVADATCTGSSCALSCLPDFGDCDGNGANGCEAELRTNVDHCGACGAACPDDFCVDGACHCGSATGEVCPPGAANTDGAPSCGGGGCTLSCADGFGDCDGEGGNGCEAALGASPNCGSCGVACAAGAACDPAQGIICGCGSTDDCTADIADVCVAGACRCGSGAPCTGNKTCTGGACL